MVVRVAIDLALDRLFDYEVPEALRGKLAVGQLLSVPFGRREARGFAVEIGERTAPPSAKLKSVSSIVDETPFFSPSLLTLVRRIAEYTAAPIESVLRAALPAAVLKRNARAKEQLFVEPAEGAPAEGLTARQKWLYDNIVRLDGGWLAQLCEELKTTPASLRALAAKGLVAIAPRARRRDPLSGRRVLPTKPLALNAQQSAALVSIKTLCEATQLGARASSPANCETTQLGARASSPATKEGLDLPLERARRPLPQGATPQDELPQGACPQGALAQGVALSPSALLLHGVTGSGKTEVYLQAIASELEKGRGAIVMVPEIALTPQTVQRFASRFGDRVAVLHSALSDGERYDEWHRIRRGEARVVVGPRSAVFAPVANLGLIVVDEEHEPSYKQEDNPRYHARDAAVLRGAIEGAAVVLGSATPSLETWMNVRRGKYACATMTDRAGLGSLPSVRLVNMQEEPGRSIFSGALLDAISLRLDRGEQTMLFLNRRGWSRSVTCEACGHVVTCPDCDLAYTYHRADDCLRCHVCGGWRPTPAKCPACGSAALSYRGIGTQRVEASLAKCFPQANVLRMDADSTSRRRSHDDILSAFRRGEAQILVGTQMIAKGLDFPNVTLVGVLNADSSLNMPDFRAAERTYQLIAQVAGRAGRAELPGEVIVQSFDPSAPAIVDAANGDYEAFAVRELKDREEGFFPPFCHLAVVALKSQDLRLVTTWSDMYAKSFAAFAAKNPSLGLVVSEAVPSALEKADGWYRWQIVLRAPGARAIISSWRTILAHRPPPKNLRFAIDMDAHNLA
ncbi:MAG: primosomal protein N' [Kiritimatiellae bacterium]|nr:primosomal protein N' [Kiritimatiellia bacterium]